MSRNAATQPTGVRSRAPTSADVPELAAFLGLCATADGTPIPEADDIGAWLNDSSHDVAGNFRLWTRDGELVAYSDLARWNDQAWLELDVRPDLRGGTLEAELLRWNVERARELGPGSGVLRRRLPASDGRGLAASQEAGFLPVRHSYLMRIELQHSPEPRPPAGITLRSFQPGEERAVWVAHQESFHDVWDHVQESYEGWHEDRIATPSFDPELWVIAEADGEIAGVLLGRIREGEGWVGVLGVRKPRRGQGLGAALLRASFSRFWERGERTVALTVDAASPTGAVRLYEREGMRVHHSWVVLERRL